IPDEAAAAAVLDVQEGAMVWQDFDMNGRPDLVLTGTQSGSASTRIYLNENGILTFQSDDPTGLLSGEVDWVDVNQDGAPDLMLSGNGTGNTPVVELWLNDGNANFSASSAILPQWTSTSQAWADWNLDGKVDLVLAGDNSGTPSFAVYVNQGGGEFAAQAGAFPAGSGLTNSKVSVGDLNNDQYPDVLITGSDGGNSISKLYRNLRNGQSAELAMNVSMDQLSGLKGQWGDFNEDGWQDIALIGQTSGGQAQAAIYRNTRNLNFVYDSMASKEILGQSQGTAAWGDFNGDHKLDLALIGQDETATASLRIYRNDEPTVNVVPDLPVGLKEEVTGNTVTLVWERPDQADSLVETGYSYNLFMAIEGNGRVIPGLADTMQDAGGLRRIAATGNGHRGYSWTIERLQEGQTYRWGVQSIGADMEGSAFAWSEFSFTPPAFDDVSADLFPGGRPAGVINSALLVGDYDNDGDLDLVASGELSLSENATSAYRYENGSFVLDTDNTDALPDLKLSSLAWGDYDGDNDLDLLICG
ncbi:MAG: VCBS repeat-containing protein, partial [Bacteroidota bacterium]